ncbi:hypothetical protein HRbin11_00430 [bacterium HR11]|nr:hypothetical protein HRbin11_00430 [bacterium HR11]
MNQRARVPSVPEWPAWIIGGLLGLLVVGTTAFIVGAAGPARLRAWSAFLVNFLFWSGVAQAGVVWAAVWHLTGARWSRFVRRVAEANAAFLPVSFLLFWVLYLGREVLFPWVRTPASDKTWWLNVPFLFLRDGLGLLVLYGVSLGLVYRSWLPVPAFRASGSDPGTATPSSVETLWETEIVRALDRTAARRHRQTTVLAAAVLILYGVVFTLLAWDLVMSLDPTWSSTLFGGYFFVGNLYAGLAVLGLATVGLHRRMGPASPFTADQFHDLGKLVFGFCLLTAYLAWSQYLPIWYGNLPEETGFVILRTETAPWAFWAKAVLVLGFVVPFVAGLSRALKRRPWGLFTLCAVVAVGMWMERYLLVVPSLGREAIPGGTLPFGWPEILITIGFLGAYGLSFLALARWFPPPAVEPYREARIANGE